jgi:hypothetical protein
MYHHPCRFQSTDAHAPLHVRREHLIFKPPNRLLEGLSLALKSPVPIDLRSERAITDLSEGLVYAVMSHVVSVQKLKYVGSNERGRDVDVGDDGGMDLAVICRAIKGESPFYKRVRGVEVGTDVTRRCFTAVFISDTEWDIGRTSIVLEACWDWRGSSSGGPRALRLLCVSGVSSIWYRLGSITSASTLTSTSSGTYTQPFGNDGLLESEAIRDDTHDLLSIIVG